MTQQKGTIGDGVSTAASLTQQHENYLVLPDDDEQVSALAKAAADIRTRADDARLRADIATLRDQNEKLRSKLERKEGFDALTREQHKQLLEFFMYRLNFDDREKLAATLPQAYNAWYGREIVKVVSTTAPPREWKAGSNA